MRGKYSHTGEETCPVSSPFLYSTQEASLGCVFITKMKTWGKRFIIPKLSLIWFSDKSELRCWQFRNHYKQKFPPIPSYGGCGSFPYPLQHSKPASTSLIMKLQPRMVCINKYSFLKLSLFMLGKGGEEALAEKEFNQKSLTPPSFCATASHGVHCHILTKKT